MRLRSVTYAIVSILLVSCGSSDDSSTEELSLLSYKQPCFTVGQGLCNIEKSADGQSLFYNQIDGFSYIWGHRYDLKVRISVNSNLVADGSSHRYELIQVLSDTEDAVGTEYKYNLVELMDNTFVKRDGEYYFLEQPFACAAAVNCDALVDLNNSGGLVNLEFEYIGQGKISLKSWN